MAQELTIATKVGMTQVYVDGKLRPVTVLRVGPCKVLATSGDKAVVSLDRGKKGLRAARETLVSGQGVEVGGEYRPTFIVPGQVIDAIGLSKGCGYAGVMKKHGFHGLGASHGVKKVHRSGGSVGQNTEPGRVHPGTEMAGRMGADRITVRNLSVVSYDPDNGTLAVVGAVPGHRNGVVVIRKAVEPRVVRTA